MLLKTRKPGHVARLRARDRYRLAMLYHSHSRYQGGPIAAFSTPAWGFGLRLSPFHSRHNVKIIFE
jgi:hypothetical protein